MLDACLYCSADLSKHPQVDLYGNPCCAICFDNAAFLKNPTVTQVPALLSADKPSSAEDLAKKNKEARRKEILMPMAAKMGPAVSELKNRLEGGCAQSTSAPMNFSASRSQTSSWASSCQPDLPVSPAPSYPKQPSAQAKSPVIHDTIPSPRLAPFTASPRPVITSPRIAASKAFFDGGIAASPASPPLSTAAGRSWSRPSPQPLQTPSWQRHRVSQSMPAVPKQEVRDPGPVWLRSPILNAKATSEAKPDKQTAQDKHTNASDGCAGFPFVPPPRKATRTLPQPPQESTTQRKDVMPSAILPQKVDRQIKDGSSVADIPSQPLASTSKVSAGILSRSKSFKCTEEGHQNGQIQDARPREKGMSEPREVAATTSMTQSISDNALVETASSAKRPLPQRSQTGLSRSNVTVKGKSPTAVKRISKHPTSSETSAARGPTLQNSEHSSAPVSSNARCPGCNLRLFSVGEQSSSSNKIISLPKSDVLYHARCFVCDKCKKPFDEGSFVELEHGEKVHDKASQSSQERRNASLIIAHNSVLPYKSKVSCLQLLVKS